MKKNVFSFLRRPWFWVLLLLVVGAVVAVVVLLPDEGQRWLLRLEARVQDSLGIQVTHDSLQFKGVGAVEIRGIEGRVADAQAPLFVIDRLLIEYDPTGMKAGLPLILGVLADGVRIQAFRKADGSSNFDALLQRLGKADQDEGEAKEGRGLLRRLLQQNPPVEVRNLRVTGLVEDPSKGLRVAFRYDNGNLKAANPSVSAVETRSAFSGGLEDTVQGGLIKLHGELDFTNRGAAISVNFGKGLPVELGNSSLRLQKLTWSRDRLLEARFTDLNLRAGTLDLGLEYLGKLGGVTKAQAAAGAIERIEALVARKEALATTLDQGFGAAAGLLAQLGYSKDPVLRLQQSWGKAAVSLAGKLLDPISGQALHFDSGRFLQTRSEGAGKGDTVLVAELANADDSKLYCKITREAASQDYAGRCSLNYTPLGLAGSGSAVYSDGQISLDFDGAMKLADPFFSLEGSGTWADGAFVSDFRLETRLQNPPAALRLDAVVREGRFQGAFEAQADITGLLRNLKATGLLAKDRWNAEVSADLESPSGNAAGSARVEASLDSRTGLRKFSVAAKEHWGVDVGSFRVFLKGAGLDASGSLVFDDLAVSEAGKDYSRHFLKMTGIRVKPGTTTGSAMGVLTNLTGDSKVGLKERLLAMVGEVELMEPHLILRQPADLEDESSAGSEDKNTEEEEDRDLDLKLQGDSRTVADKTTMAEPLRKAIGGSLKSMEDRLRAGMALMTRLGNLFPIERVKIVNGQVEYAKAVAPEDRLLSDVSRFYAEMEKLPGGSSFNLSASFITPDLSGEVANRIQARVNLINGDLSGSLELPAFPLLPYRFLMPAAVVLSAQSRIADSKLDFVYQGERELLSVFGDFNLEHISLNAPAFSSLPLRNISVSLSLGDSPAAAVEADLGAHTLDLGTRCYARLNNGPRWRMRARIEYPNPDFPKLMGDLELETTPFQQLLDTMPPAILGDLTKLRVQGYLSASLNLEVDSADLSKTVFDFAFNEKELEVITYPPTLDVTGLNEPFSHRVRTGEAKDRVMRVGEGPDWVPLDLIPPWMVLAVSTTEDGSFFRHKGFNEFQWKMSIIDNLQEGRFARGASTISMQLVKNLFLGPEKTVSRKLQELILTWLLEKEVSKSRIMEIYLNIIEWGQDIYGLSQASWHYFGIAPSQITISQAAFLTAFIPQPRPFDQRFKEGFKEGGRDSAWRKWWARRLSLVKRIGKFMVNNCDRLDSKCPGNASPM
jgi:hypothetical protein